ncbi:MAG TPA: tetratricopeptide repeat protein, partial [Ktedonobacteraceae bacterium]
LVSMHPLIQAALRKTFAQEERQQRITQLLHASQQFMLTREGGARFIRLCVTGHIRRLAAQSEEGDLAGDEVANALNQAASLLWEQGLIRDAEALVQKALAIWEHTPGPTRPETATALLNLTVMNSVLKRYDRAEEMAQRAIAATAEALGVDHPDVLLALNILGNIFQQQGKQQNAKRSYQEVLAIGERVGLQMHAYYFSSMYDLAVLNIELGQLDEALAGLERVCAVWEEAEPERYQVARMHLERLQATKTPEANYAGYE